MVIQKIFSSNEGEEKIYSVLLSEDELVLFQREFTRGDSAAIRELYKATNGFRRFPKGATNLSARDLVRLKQLARGKERGLNELFETFNTEEGKQLLRKMDLHKTADGIEHLATKYQNDALADRYKRIQKTSDAWKRQAKREEYIAKKREQINTLKNKLRERNSRLMDKADKVQNLESTFFDRTKDSSDPTIIERNMNGFNRAFRLRKRLESRIHSPNEKDLIAKRAREIQAEIDQSLPSITENEVYSKKYIDRTHHMGEGYNKSLNYVYPEYTYQDRQLKKKFIEHAKKRDGLNVRTDSSAHMELDGYKDAATMHISRGASPFTAGHEAGHLRAHRSDIGKLSNQRDNLDNLVDEAMASSHAISRGKLLGATPEQLKEGRVYLENAFNTYHQGYINDLAGDLNRRYFL